jgi:hypothetical protein
MPFQFDQATTASGLRYLIVDASDQVGMDDGLALEAWLLPGQPHNLGYILSRVAKGTEYSPEVRKFFSTYDKMTAIAVVVTSPIVRAAINMMVRFGTTKARLRMFTSEPEALAWLESQSTVGC